MVSMRLMYLFPRGLRGLDKEGLIPFCSLKKSFFFALSATFFSYEEDVGKDDLVVT